MTLNWHHVGQRNNTRPPAVIELFVHSSAPWIKGVRYTTTWIDGTYQSCVVHGSWWFVELHVFNEIVDVLHMNFRWKGPDHPLVHSIAYPAGNGCYDIRLPGYEVKLMRNTLALIPIPDADLDDDYLLLESGSL